MFVGASRPVLPAVDRAVAVVGAGLHALTHGLPSWDLGAARRGGHGNVLFFSALAPARRCSRRLRRAGLRGVLAGLAVGVAAHLAFFAVVPMFALHRPLRRSGSV